MVDFHREVPIFINFILKVESLFSVLSPSASRENLKQWEKVIRGEEAYGWIPTQSNSTDSDSLPVKIDD